MSHFAYYEAPINAFLAADEDAILGMLAMHHGFALEHQQKHAWHMQIKLLREVFPKDLEGQIYFEFSIPRVGKRADTVLLTGGVVFVIEFKIGSFTYDRYAIEQTHDYALDLKNFHLGSHQLPIVPILIPSDAPLHPLPEIKWAKDQVAEPISISPARLPNVIEMAVREASGLPINAAAWSHAGYKPTPTIVEAALALYRQHDVKEITRSEAGADNLGITAKRVNQIIEYSRSELRKAICFVTGVPGAGKTLAGLNIATSNSERHSDENAVFLSGNGPLVDVLREALARDKAVREGVPRSKAYREACTFVQNIHHFRDDALANNRPPVERVVIFDEAQRAWNREMTSKFMKQKRGYSNFDMSEPALLLKAMNRHEDWCVVICLIGGGQEINTGEAGLGEWLAVLRDQHPDWDVHVSSRINDPNYVWDAKLATELSRTEIFPDPNLHLSVSIRSFRAEALSDFVGLILDDKPDLARRTYDSIADKYPILLTRSLAEARSWVREQARGSERYGLVASSGANRLRPDGIWMRSKVDAPTWFLNDKTDVRSSYYLEEAASEFDIQGLELDWVCVGWDADFRRGDNEWQYFNFRGTKWQRVLASDHKLYLKNAYRVLLTRARQGMVIYIPYGDLRDPTRDPKLYDGIYEYLLRCGLTANVKL